MTDLNMYITGIVLIIIGYLTCFHGFKMKKILFTIIWFLIGFFISKQIFANSFEEIEMLYTLSSVIGLLCALFSYKIELFNVFVASGWMIGSAIYPKLNFASNVNIIVVIIVGIIAGLIAIKFVKPLIIISTSLVGARIIADGVTQLPLVIDPLIVFGIEVVLFVLGILYQFKTQKHAE